MDILAQSPIGTQEALENVMRGMPVVLDDSRGRLGIMIKDLPDDLERYILDGVAGSKRFHVFTKEQEAELAGLCARQCLKITYRDHGIEYMGKVSTITYPQISDPSAGTQIVLVPWFMQIGRPYPIFANMYGVWHYMETGRKSMQESAEAVAKVFGIASFSKSTISRNLKEMDRIYGERHIEGPLPIVEQETPSFEGLALLVLALLKASQAAAPLDGPRGGGPNPRARAAAGCGEAAHAALGAIPRRLSEVIAGKSGAPQKRRAARKRPARRRGAGSKKKRPALPFAKPQAIAQARREFIAACRGIAMHAAAQYHSAML